MPSVFSSPPTVDELSAYAASLFERLPQAEHIPFRAVEINGQAAPQRNCHENARLWSENNPGWVVVDGWLCLEGGPLSPFTIFVAHSVVRDPTGQVVDVTPLIAQEPRPFLPANLPQEDFERAVEVLVRATGRANLVHPK